jgi:BolA protein
MDLAAEIRARLAPLAPESLELIDESGAHVGHEGARGGGSHFRLTVVARCFSGRNKLARHRMIYAALGDLLRRDIHALAINARAPDEL